MKRFFIIAIVLLMTLSSAAQMTKEVYVGYSSVMDYVKVSAFGRTSEETGYGKGLEVGLNYIRPITKPLAVTYGIQAMYGWDKGTVSNSNVSGKDQFIKFLVPVSLLCELRPSSSRFAFEPFVGINGSFYALGKTKIGGTTYDWFDGKDSFELNRLLFGWHVGANFVYDRFVLGFNYQEDFLDYADSSPFLQADARWANIEFRFGYRF
jgi:hypothetical protein